MAGDRTAYEDALRIGSACVREQRWEQAVTAYRQALTEFANDPDALGGLGLALAGCGRLADALRALQQAVEADPDNPVWPEQVAAVLQQSGHEREAARAYLLAAERYARRQTPAMAVERWKDAIRADPHSLPAHVNLLRAYLTQGKTGEALEECLTLAGLYADQGQTQQALEICGHALKLDPHNHQALTMLDSLRQGEAAQADPLGLDEPDFLFAGDGEQAEETGSPVEMTRQKALADLAEVVFKETAPQTGPLTMRPLSKREVDALLSQALDHQTLGETDRAIACYEQVVQGGVIQPAVHFNLGLLYQQRLRFEDAIAQFQQAVEVPEYRLGSLFALGECYRAVGRIDDALAHFIEVLKVVDLGTVGREQADDLIQLYEELAHTYAAKGERDQAVEFVNSLISFLSEKGWEDKALQARQRLDTLASEGPVMSLAELLAVPGSKRILQSISLAQEYQRRGLKYAALDELSLTISIAPTFLPLHRQMAETLVSMGKVDQAVAKFLAIADTYQVRGNFSHATAMYERALRLAPMNVAVRAKLIDLFVSHGKIDKALEHYLVLGDTYYQMAQLDRAREMYNEALRLAPRGNPDRRWAVRFLHRIGDLDLQRIDWRQALAVYEQIRSLAPDDEKARLTLMDLYYRFGQPDRAVVELDELLRHYREAGKLPKAITILQERVQEHPDDIALRTRLAQVHLNAGNVSEALQELDVLGDLQLQAGRTKDAIATIQTILRLHPPNAEAYHELLKQLTTGQLAS